MKAKFIVAFVGAWIAVGIVIFWAKAVKPTPEKLQAYLEKNPITAVSAEPARQEIIGNVATTLNRLNFEQRQELRRKRDMMVFFENLTAKEKTEFLRLTIPEGFKQMMDAVNKMSPERRKKVVQRALEDLDKGKAIDGSREPDLTEEQRKLIVEQGISSFYENASADTKLDVTPIMERIQQITQNMQ